MGFLSRVFAKGVRASKGARRLGGAQVDSRQDQEENILVISDIHLGEDILISGPAHLGEYIRALNRELAQFVAHHRDNVEDGRAWHLVIDGDMFDFVKVSLKTPEHITKDVGTSHRSGSDKDDANAELEREDPTDTATDTATTESDADSSRDDLSAAETADQQLSAGAATPELVLWKLQRILEIHRPLFKEIALFLLAGHRVTIIEGNHDAEFYFEGVQQSLRAFVVKEAEKFLRRTSGLKTGGKSGGKDLSHYSRNYSRNLKQENLAGVGDRLVFRQWFCASPGRFHIEHGHQYDQYCSFEYNLSPTEASSEDIATPMSHKIMPYSPNRPEPNCSLRSTSSGRCE